MSVKKRGWGKLLGSRGAESKKGREALAGRELRGVVRLQLQKEKQWAVNKGGTWPYSSGSENI